MSWIDNIAEYLLSERPKLTSKALLVLFSMFIIYFVNSVLGFSYYYSNEKKLEQVRKLNEMISDEKSDSTARMFAIKLRREIIERQDCIRTFIAYWNNITFSSKDQVSPALNLHKNNPPRSSFWWQASTAGLFYLFALIMFPVILFTDKQTTPLSQRFLIGLFAFFTFSVLGLLITWLCHFIVLISENSWTWNYLLNFIIQFCILILLIYLLQKQGNKK